jgi:hypothetical protein
MIVPNSSERLSERPRHCGPILAAALALPGIALAEGAPQDGLIGLKYLYYKEIRDLGGTGLKPLTVNSPSVYALVPFGGRFSVEASAVVDSLSGATPRWHTAVSSASKMSDNRTAGDVHFTTYFRRAAVGVGVAYSNENDYLSRAVSLDARISSEDNNTTFSFGIGGSRDTVKVNTEHPGSQGGLPIDANGNPIAQKKKGTDLLAGVTQVLTPVDIVQANLTYTQGKGYLADPYKWNDARPDKRNQLALLARWNHNFSDVGGTLRLSYRFYHDSYEVKANSVGAEWVQPYGALTFTPELRYHTQSAARFYVDPVAGQPVPLTTSTQSDGAYSVDYRLSAFGALTAGLKLGYQIDKDWSVDAKASYYEQRGDWRLGGKGSPGLDPFRAQWYQVGVYRRL